MRPPVGNMFSSTWIVTPLFVTDLSTARTFAVKARDAGADAIELRCDRTEATVIEAVLRDPEIRRLKTILTIRPAWEGGGFTGSEAQRLELLRLACRYQPDLIDVEWKAWQNSAGFADVLAPCLMMPETWRASAATQRRAPGLIISNHDFVQRPADLHQRVAAMAAIPEATVLKVAFAAADINDAVAALNLYNQRSDFNDLPLVAIAMGEAGQISRLLAAKFGAAFTFAQLDAEAHSAPGQPPISTLMQRFRFKEQRADWRVFGLVGSPVSHSVSPMIHNAGFAQTGYAGVYVPLLTAPGYDNFIRTINGLRRLPGMNLGGVSVTIPHKSSALAYASEESGTIDPVAQHIGAVNTLFFPPGGGIRAMNSDAAGAVAALTSGMGIKAEMLRDSDVAILGAGGAARAIVAALCELGARIAIYNRTPARAVELAQQFTTGPGRIQARDIHDFSSSHHKIVINCTAAGMTPHVNDLPFPSDAKFYADQIVFDTVYNPRRTRFLQMAQHSGATCVEGLEMLLSQAAAQFEGFTGQPVPSEAMRAAALDALGR